MRNLVMTSVYTRPPVQNYGVEVGRQDGLWGREYSGNRVAALHLASRVFLAGKPRDKPRKEKKRKFQIIVWEQMS